MHLAYVDISHRTVGGSTSSSFLDSVDGRSWDNQPSDFDPLQRNPSRSKERESTKKTTGDLDLYHVYLCMDGVQL